MFNVTLSTRHLRAGRSPYLVHVQLEANVDTVALGHGSLELVELLGVGGKLHNRGRKMRKRKG